MAVLDLRVLIAGVPAGTLHQDAQGIMSFAEEVFEESSGLPGADELREHLLPHVAANCRNTLALL